MTAKWSNELKQEILELWKDNTATEIAGILWDRYRIVTTRNAIIGVVSRAGQLHTPKERPHKNTTRAKRIPKPKAEHRPVLRIISGGGCGGYKVTQNFATDMPVLRAVEVESRHLSLLDLQANDCRYPDDGNGPHKFCGHPKSPNHPSYCAAHHYLTVRHAGYAEAAE